MCTRHGASSNFSCISQYQNCVDAMNMDRADHFIRFKAESHRMHGSVSSDPKKIDGLIRVQLVHRVANAMS